MNIKKTKNKIIKKAIKQALSGDEKMIVFVLDKVFPIYFPQTVEHPVYTLDDLKKKVAEGKINPDIGKKLIEFHAKVAEIEEIPKLMKQLEALSKKQR
jgi:hypothetical protein